MYSLKNVKTQCNRRNIPWIVSSYHSGFTMLRVAFKSGDFAYCFDVFDAKIDEIIILSCFLFGLLRS